MRSSFRASQAHPGIPDACPLPVGRGERGPRTRGHGNPHRRSDAGFLGCGGSSWSYRGPIGKLEHATAAPELAVRRPTGSRSLPLDDVVAIHDRGTPCRPSRSGCRATGVPAGHRGRGACCSAPRCPRCKSSCVAPGPRGERARRESTPTPGTQPDWPLGLCRAVPGQPQRWARARLLGRPAVRSALQHAVGAPRGRAPGRCLRSAADIRSDARAADGRVHALGRTPRGAPQTFPGTSRSDRALVPDARSLRGLPLGQLRGPSRWLRLPLRGGFRRCEPELSRQLSADFCCPTLVCSTLVQY